VNALMVRGVPPHHALRARAGGESDLVLALRFCARRSDRTSQISSPTGEAEIFFPLRHREEPTGPREVARPDDTLSDEAIQQAVGLDWIASLRLRRRSQ
jgi:hypothetical protein